MNRSQLAKQQGVALITVLLLISLLSLIGIAAMQMSALQTRIARAQQQMDFARNVADAGLQEAATYIDTGHANYTAESSLPITPSYSIDGESPTLEISASSNGIYTLSSDYAMNTGSSANLTASIRRPMAAALLNGDIQLSTPSSLSGIDQCGNHDLVGLASTQSSEGAAIKGGGTFIRGVTSPPSYVLNMSLPDIPNLISTLVAAGIPDKTTADKNYNIAHGDPSSDATCNLNNMYVLHATNPDFNLKASGCGLLLVEGNLTITQVHWRGLAIVGGQFEAKGNASANSAGIIGAVISGANTTKTDVSLKDGGYVQWCSTAANWANDLTRETGAQLWFSHWTDL